MWTSASRPAESTADERAGRVVRVALRVFRDGIVAADWLVTPNAALGGEAALFAARASDLGCLRACEMLAAVEDDAE